MASVWVPYTSEGKQNIARYPEIIKEIKLAVQECGRELGKYTRKQRRNQAEAKRKEIFIHYIPLLANALTDIVGSDNRSKQVLIERLRERI